MVAIVVTASTERFRDPLLGESLDRAIASAAPADRGALFDKLRRASGLPGPRVNVGLVKAFASEAAARGARADRLIAAMVALDEDVAPHGHVDEILPVLGVAATGARAASDPAAREKLLEALEEAACDRRHRVREAAADGLVKVGVAVGPSFVDVLLRWIDEDQPWMARAALSGMGQVELAAAIGNDGCVQIFRAACARLAREHRAGRRHEAYRRLLAIFPEIIPAVTARFPRAAEALVEVLNDQSARHPVGADEEVRSALTEAARVLEKKGQPEHARAILAAMGATQKPSRDPRWDRLPGRRGRGKKL